MHGAIMSGAIMIGTIMYSTIMSSTIMNSMITITNGAIAQSEIIKGAIIIKAFKNPWMGFVSGALAHLHVHCTTIVGVRVGDLSTSRRRHTRPAHPHVRCTPTGRTWKYIAGVTFINTRMRT